MDPKKLSNIRFVLKYGTLKSEEEITMPIATLSQTVFLCFTDLFQNISMDAMPEMPDIWINGHVLVLDSAGAPAEYSCAKATGWQSEVDNKPLAPRIYEIQGNAHRKGHPGIRCKERDRCLLCGWEGLQDCMRTPWGCYYSWDYSPEGRSYMVWYHREEERKRSLELSIIETTLPNTQPWYLYYK
jgi:hypothetical protein